MWHQAITWMLKYTKSLLKKQKTNRVYQKYRFGEKERFAVWGWCAYEAEVSFGKVCPKWTLCRLGPARFCPFSPNPRPAVQVGGPAWPTRPSCHLLLSCGGRTVSPETITFTSHSHFLNLDSPSVHCFLRLLLALRCAGFARSVEMTSVCLRTSLDNVHILDSKEKESHIMRFKLSC